MVLGLAIFSHHDLDVIGLGIHNTISWSSLLTMHSIFFIFSRVLLSFVLNVTILILIWMWISWLPNFMFAHLLVAINSNIDLIIIVKILEVLLPLDHLSPIELLLCQSKGFLCLIAILDFELLSCHCLWLSHLIWCHLHFIHNRRWLFCHGWGLAACTLFPWLCRPASQVLSTLRSLLRLVNEAVIPYVFKLSRVSLDHTSRYFNNQELRVEKALLRFPHLWGLLLGYLAWSSVVWEHF